MNRNPGNRNISHSSFRDNTRIYQGDVNITVQSSRSILPIGGLSDASFNSAGRQHDPRCLPGTRVEILSQIRAWADREEENRMFWLCGMAGTGKLTISLIVAHEYHGEKRLAASFFFSRGRGNLASVGDFVITIAAQLAELSPKLRELIAAAIESSPRIAGLGLYEQWEKLVLEPLSRMHPGTVSRPYLLVVDALDECDNQDDVALLIQCLASTAANGAALRVFVTSRPDQHINFTFDGVSPRAQDLTLHVIEPSVINKDLELYYRYQITHISRQLSLGEMAVTQETIQILVQKSHGLFIHAATVCRFIRNGGLVATKRLAQVIDTRNLPSQPQKELDEIYTTVLEHAVASGLDTEEMVEVRKGFRDSVGTIVTSFDTMDLPTLSALIGTQSNVLPLLSRLQAVLAINTSEPSSGQIRILHPSFRDFLLDSKRCTNNMFYIDARTMHTFLLNRCLEIMSEHLHHRNVCDLQRPGIRATDISGSDVDGHVPAVVQYACSYWIHHLKQSDADPVQSGIIDFFQTRFLFWVEVLALIGRLSDGVAMVRLLDSLLAATDPSANPLGLLTKIKSMFSWNSVDGTASALGAIVHDAKQFLISHSSMIEENPLQLYCSALTFSPRASIIRQLYRTYIPHWVESASCLREAWSPYIQSLHHSEAILAVAFSPNGRLLASGCVNGRIYLWDAITGTNRRTLSGHHHSISCVLFSSDSALIVSASIDHTIRLWNSTTGKELRVLKHASAVLGVSISQSSRFAASLCSDGKVWMWDVAAGTRQWISQENRSISSAVFSPDSKKIAYACGADIQLHDPVSGARLAVLEGSSAHAIRSIDFSADGNLIASGTFERIELWNASTRLKLRDIIVGPRQHTYSKNITLSFLPNSKFVAGAIGEMIVLWDVASGAKWGEFTHRNASDLHMMEPFEYSYYKYCMAFSHDGTFMASGSVDGIVRLWDTAARIKPSLGIQLQHHHFESSSIAVSPDGRRIISISEDAFRLWDTQKAVELCSRRGGFLGSRDVVKFSLDSKIVAAGWQRLAGVSSGWGIWDAESGAELHTHIWRSSQVSFRAIDLSFDNKTIAIAWKHGSKTTIQLWDVSARAELRALSYTWEDIISISFSPNGKSLAVASSQSQIHVYDVQTGAELYEIQGNHVGEYSVVFSPDCDLFVCQDLEKGKTILRSWSAETGDMLHTFNINDCSTIFSKFSPHSNVLAVGSDDGSIRLWDASTNEKSQTLHGHSRSISVIEFIRDGDIMISASKDMSVRIWDLATGSTVHTLDVDIEVESLSLYPCGDHLITASGVIPISPSSPPDCCSSSIYAAGGWIKKGDEDIIFIPPDYRRRLEFVAGDVAVFSIPVEGKDKSEVPSWTVLRLSAVGDLSL